ncbi:carbon storage regulator CsrA [Clostridium sp. Marseille-Q2269]|uniref:carbon storage regulator CsrA n=1 Tax=Clostridium sp. Marseille-Q2269 TaxID=2942205 RepID=UPI0020732C6F|nr:carbon storage regulator CsrA [Clostridium sp. Marseille-Q2269]
MLVITRKKGESILIGDDIEITVVKLDDGSAKLAIDAPKKLTILRKELYNEIQEENKKATNFNPSILKDLKNK